MDEVPYYLYKITNLINGKLYIGVTKDIQTRKRQHFYNKGQNKKSLIRKAMNKYGPENFKFEVICAGSCSYIYDLEVKAISVYETTEKGYNIKPGGIGGLGHKVQKRKDDEPIYATGFWFPNRRVCLDRLRINAATYHAWKSEGTLGETVHYRKGAVYDAPQYFGGFWFPTLRKASEILQRDAESIYNTILIGYVEQNSYIKNHNARIGSWKVSHNGTLYRSITDAVKKTGIAKHKIVKYLKENREGFTYEYSYDKTKRPIL